MNAEGQEPKAESQTGLYLSNLRRSAYHGTLVRTVLKRRQPERRRWKRQWFNGSVRLFSPSAHIDGLGITVSPGGMYLFAIADLPVGTRLTVEFQPPYARETVMVSGTIRHRTIYLYGVEFDQGCETSPAAAAVGQTSEL